MPKGPLGEAATEPGPGVEDGITTHSYKCVQVSFPLEGVCEVLFTRPEAMNAMSIDFIRDMHQICDVLQYPMASRSQEAACRVLILRGTGRAFCAGIDLKDKRVGAADGPFLQHAYSALIKKLRDLPQAIVCGVNGIAAGGGMSLALSGDVCIGTAGCRYLPSYVRLGLGGGELGTSYFL